MKNKYVEDSILALKGISKSFANNIVLENINLDIEKGKIIAILGQNGAGKSTLMKILNGQHPYGSYGGTFYLKNKECQFFGVKDAEENGIIMIPQEIEVFRELTVAENLYMHKFRDSFLVDWNMIFKKAKDDLSLLEIYDISPYDLVGNLSKAKQQLLLITKAIIHSRERGTDTILILDEPTSSLTKPEVLTLFNHLRNLKKQGVTCIYISHILTEVLEIADQIVVIRDGTVVLNKDTKHCDLEETISAIVGKKLRSFERTKKVDFGEVLLEVKDLQVLDRKIKDRVLVDNISFKVHRGEILGIYGLLGSGKTEIAMSIYGAWDGKSKGTVRIKGKNIVKKSVKQSIELGIGIIPEDRGKFLFMERPIRENMVVTIIKKLVNRLGLIDNNKERKIANNLKNLLSINAKDLEENPSKLSGGNKQKVIVSRLIAADSEILILDEPTVGVDINTRYEIYKILRDIAEKEKKGVLLFSNDVEEIFKLCNQIMVINNGRQEIFYNQDQLLSSDINEETILKKAMA